MKILSSEETRRLLHIPPHYLEDLIRRELLTVPDREPAGFPEAAVLELRERFETRRQEHLDQLMEFSCQIGMYA